MSKELSELSGRVGRAQARIEHLMARAEQRLEIKDDQIGELEVDGYCPDAALEALQLLASSVIVDEIKEQNLRLALNEMAKRFEALDDWMSGGGKYPEQWQR